MATYPTGIASLSTSSPTSTSPTNSPSHASLHTQVNGEIVAIETELGINPSGNFATVAAAITGSLSTLTAINFTGPSTAVERAYICVPFGVSAISGTAVPSSGTTGTGASIVISLTNTAGGTILSGTFASAATAGATTLTLAAGGTTTVAATGIICITKASCATAYGVTISLYMAKTAL